MITACRAAWLLVSFTGCYHTVAVFAPARDVPAGTDVIGFVGTLGSVALGTTIFAVGLHGELRVTRTIAVAPTSLVLRF